MYEIAIINPRRAPKRRKKSGKKSGAKIMAKRKTRRKAKRKAVAAPKRRRRSAAGKRRPAMGYVVGSRKIRRRKLNPRRAKRRSSRRHSNPRFSVSGITGQFMPAIFGAGGGLAVDVALGYIPLPAMLQTGYGKHAARIIAALGVGWLGRKFLGSRGAAVGAGALTIATYGLLKDVAAQVTAGKVKGLGDYEEITVQGYYDPAPAIGAYMQNSGVGAYMSGDGTDSSMYDSVGAMDY